MLTLSTRAIGTQVHPNGKDIEIRSRATAEKVTVP